MALIGLFSGTFDPLTRGHMDIIERALPLFDQLIVAVAQGHHKQPWLPLADRVMLAEGALAQWSSVQVLPMSGLLVTFAKAHQVDCLLRGVRDGHDVAYELRMATLNKQLHPGLETVFLPASSSYAALSATVVRDVAKLGGDVTPWVTDAVAAYLSSLEVS